MISAGSKPAMLALADGRVFCGISCGAPGIAVGEVVFNTSMTGYQEILTDPSYARQMVVLTAAHIGNTGINTSDVESARIWASGLIVRDVPDHESSWRSQSSLENYLKAQGVVAISQIDTRALTRVLRDNGVQSACIAAGDNLKPRAFIEKARDFVGIVNADLAKEVCSQSTYTWSQGSWDLKEGCKNFTHAQLPYHVVVCDFGVKRSILRCLVDQGCRLTVVPAKTPAKAILDLSPDGVFLSNGPGDPAACQYAILMIRELLQSGVPLFGVCLGHQLLALACGAKILKMKFGHHGANHPVQDVDTKAVFISSQNHGFAVDTDSLPDCLRVTHISLFDQSIQGISHKDKPVFGFQGHPEGGPGPHDLTTLLFQRFVQHMSKAAGDSQPLQRESV